LIIELSRKRSYKGIMICQTRSLEEWFLGFNPESPELSAGFRENKATSLDMLEEKFVAQGVMAVLSLQYFFLSVLTSTTGFQSAAA